MICKQCNKEFQAKRKTAVYCSSTCRKAAFVKNKNKPDNSVQKDLEDSVTVPLKDSVLEDSVLKEIVVKIEEVCTPEELRDYPRECETKQEQKESIYRLENNSLEDLQKKKIYIPGWRIKSQKYPIDGNN